VSHRQNEHVPLVPGPLVQAGDDDRVFIAERDEIGITVAPTDGAENASRQHAAIVSQNDFG
jgi:hypothetical protein